VSAGKKGGCRRADNDWDFRAIVSVIVVTERLAREAEEGNTSMFFAQLFDKSLSRQRAMFDSFIVGCHGLLRLELG
jgi:hypothetical protein